MSAQDPFSLANLIGIGTGQTVGIDPNTGQITIGNVPINVNIPQLPTNPTQVQPPGNPPSWLSQNAGQIAGAGATALGAYLNYQAQAARNDLLKQQISSNNAISQADQARRDYYASILMPSILQGLRNNNPQTLAAVQGQQNQSMHFPAPLTFSGTGVTAGQAPPASTGTTPTSAASLTQGAPVGTYPAGQNNPNVAGSTGGNTYVSSGGVDPWGNPLNPTSPYQEV